ncbi:MAG TPA: hypothetical protein VF210_10550 [Pseudomonadales bacterium]
MHQMTHTGRAIIAGAALLLTGTAWAVAPSSFSESRGYRACVDSARDQAHLIHVNSNYYIADHGDSRRYYLNGYAFRGGESTEVKIACDTTLSGHRVLGVSVDLGQYAGRIATPIEVAGN